jgi:hypothetical protein
MSPSRASSLGLEQTHYDQETPKYLKGEWLEMDKVSGVFCFSLCAGEEDPLSPLHSPQPFCLCLCLAIWQMGEMRENQNKNTSLDCMLKNFKRGFNRDYRVNS